MKSCAVCNQQHDGKPVTLITGKTVCDYSEAWRVECEARHILRMPLGDRRMLLVEIEKRRGAKATAELKSIMRVVFYAARN